jgi:transcriptional regulator with XRE-family HTH domain
LVDKRRAFGERLRRHRERQHVTLETIAKSTKVAASLFAGLERGDCSRWPGGMYNRSFIRGYALAIKLDPDEIAAEFVEYYEPEPEAAPRPAGTPQAASALRAPSVAPLRLTLDVNPAEPALFLVRRAGLALADIIIVLTLATLIARTIGTNFWTTLSLISLTYLVLGRVFAGVWTADRLIARTVRTEVTEEAPADESPVGGTASTIA